MHSSGNTPFVDKKDTLMSELGSIILHSFMILHKKLINIFSIAVGEFSRA